MLKTQIIIDPVTKKVISIAFGMGSIHDYKLLLNSNSNFHPEAIVLADSGYQGLDKIHQNTILPIKKSKNQPRTKESKSFNYWLSQTRIRVEHVFAKLKRFKILKNCYRGKLKRFKLRFNLISGIYNLEQNLTTT